MADRNQGEIPGQESFALQLSEKPRITQLVEDAQNRGILTPTTQLDLPEGYNKPVTKSVVEREGFTFNKALDGLTIETSRQGKHSVNLIPIALQVLSPESTSQDWVLFFAPVGRNQTRILIPDLANKSEAVSLNLALPITEWPKDEYGAVVDLLVNSRQTLVYPPRYSALKRHEYDPVFDIWNHYLRNKGQILPEKVKATLEATGSLNQEQYLAQHAKT
jgi:hypothetical protein